jgi:hypothetical protein
MSDSLIVDLLAERPAADLKTQREQKIAQRRRIDVEVEQIDEALARQAKRRAGKAPVRPSGLRRETTRQLVLRTVREHGRCSPVQIRARLKLEGRSDKTVYNMLKTLVEEGAIVRVSTGVYELASSNGSGRESFSEAPSSGPGSTGDIPVAPAP